MKKSSILAITLASILALGGAGVGGYYLHKELTENRPGSVEVSCKHEGEALSEDNLLYLQIKQVMPTTVSCVHFVEGHDKDEKYRLTLECHFTDGTKDILRMELPKAAGELSFNEFFDNYQKEAVVATICKRFESVKIEQKLDETSLEKLQGNWYNEENGKVLVITESNIKLATAEFQDGEWLIKETIEDMDITSMSGSSIMTLRCINAYGKTISLVADKSGDDFMGIIYSAEKLNFVRI